MHDDADLPAHGLLRVPSRRATLMLDNGVREEDVAQQLGHSDGGELVRQLYGHPDGEIRRVRLDNVMRNRTREIERRREPEPPRDLDARPDDRDDLTGPADSLAARRKRALRDLPFGVCADARGVDRAWV